MRKLLFAIVLSGLSLTSALAQSPVIPPAGAQVIFPVDMFPIPGPTPGAGLETCSSACNNTTILGPIDTTGYSGIAVQYVSLGTGVQVQFQGSNDLNCATATNWITVAGLSVGGTTTPTPVVTVSTGFAALTYAIPKTTHCFRSQIIAYASGTVSAQGFLLTGYTNAFQGTQISNVNPYPLSPNGTASNPITGVGTGSTGAVTATLAGVANKTTYICGFDVSAIGGTASVGPVTVGTLIGGNTYTYQLSASAAGSFLSREFTPCIPTTAANTAITITTTADGSATAVDVNAHGFQF